MDALQAQAAEVERAVFFHTADLLTLEVDMLIYDTTTGDVRLDTAALRQAPRLDGK